MSEYEQKRPEISRSVPENPENPADARKSHPDDPDELDEQVREQIDRLMAANDALLRRLADG